MWRGHHTNNEQRGYTSRSPFRVRVGQLLSISFRRGGRPAFRIPHSPLRMVALSSHAFIRAWAPAGNAGAQVKHTVKHSTLQALKEFPSSGPESEPLRIGQLV